MPKIEFVKNRPPLEVPYGANLMRSLQAADIPVASSCDGDGVCVKCRLQIVEGAQNLSPENDLEQFLREQHDIPKNERVSCQTEVRGDVKVNAGYW
jgi:2Fe-2S ferredoxin